MTNIGMRSSIMNIWCPTPGLNRELRPCRDRTLPIELVGHIWLRRRDSNPQGTMAGSYEHPEIPFLTPRISYSFDRTAGQDLVLVLISSNCLFDIF